MAVIRSVLVHPFCHDHFFSPLYKHWNSLRERIVNVYHHWITLSIWSLSDCYGDNALWWALKWDTKISILCVNYSWFSHPPLPETSFTLFFQSCSFCASDQPEKPLISAKSTSVITKCTTHSSAYGKYLLYLLFFRDTPIWNCNSIFPWIWTY